MLVSNMDFCPCTFFWKQNPPTHIRVAVRREALRFLILALLMQWRSAEPTVNDWAWEGQEKQPALLCLSVLMVLPHLLAGAGNREHRHWGTTALSGGQEVEHGPGTQPVFVVCAKEAAELGVPWNGWRLLLVCTTAPAQSLWGLAGWLTSGWWIAREVVSTHHSGLFSFHTSWEFSLLPRALPMQCFWD